MNKLTNKEKEQVIEQKSMQILHFLNLRKKNSNLVEQMEIVLRLYKYTVQNIYPDNQLELENTSGTKEEEYLNELYKGICSNSGEPVTNVILFKHLLYMKGFDTDIVLTTSKSGEPHLANLVKIGKERYYFDPSLERSIFVSEEDEDPDRILYCCAGLGKEEYGKFYTPKGVLPKKLGRATDPIPSGVAEESLPRTLIESIGKLIPDLKSKDNPEFDKFEEVKKPKSFGFSKKSSSPEKNEPWEREEQ